MASDAVPVGSHASARTAFDDDEEEEEDGPTPRLGASSRRIVRSGGKETIARKGGRRL